MKHVVLDLSGAILQQINDQQIAEAGNNVLGFHPLPFEAFGHPQPVETTRPEAIPQDWRPAKAAWLADNFCTTVYCKTL